MPDSGKETMPPSTDDPKEPVKPTETGDGDN